MSKSIARGMSRFVEVATCWMRPYRRTNTRSLVSEYLSQLISVDTEAGPLSFGIGLAWKITATAEFLTRETGVGFQIKHFGSLFNLGEVFAWTLIFAVVLIIIEFGIFGIIDSWVTRWRQPVAF